MDWTSLGNGVVAACFLCALVAICVFAMRALGRKPASFLAVFAALSVAATIRAQKTNGVFMTGLTGLMGTGNLVNLVNPVQNIIPVQTTLDDIARGWRVESAATNAAVSYEMPASAELVGNWHAIAECKV